jgi:integrase
MKLARAEVQSLFDAVTEPRFRAVLRLMYHCGLRVGEAVAIEVRDVHGRENPPRLHIRNGKGGKDRFVPVAPAMIKELRQWWMVHRNPTFLLPSPGRGWADRRASARARRVAVAAGTPEFGRQAMKITPTVPRRAIKPAPLRQVKKRPTSEWTSARANGFPLPQKSCPHALPAFRRQSPCRDTRAGNA